MPTVHVQGGFRIVINTHDHAPAHVHVWYQGDEAVIAILDEIKVRRRDRGFDRRLLTRALQIVYENKEYLLERWGEIHE